MSEITPATDKKETESGSGRLRRKGAETRDTGTAAKGTRSRHSSQRRPYLRIFSGIVLMLVAAYICIVSISYLSTVKVDQSLVENRTVSYLTQQIGTTSEVHNTGGPIGAKIADGLISGWLGFGSFIMVFYMLMIGLALVGVHKIRFWSLTLKCLMSAITLSMVLGLITFETAAPFYWGGEHGYYMNKLMVNAAGIWGALVVDCLLVVVTVMIFYTDLLAAYHRYHARYLKHRKHLMELRGRRIAERKKREQQQWEQRARENAARREASRTPEPEPKAPDPVATSVTHAPKPVADLARPVGEETVTISSGSHEVADAAFQSQTQQESVASVTDEVQMTVREATPIEQADTPLNSEAYDPTAELSRYRFPTLELLHEVPPRTTSIDQVEQEENKQRITQTLANYGIEIAQIDATVGPTVTLYEIVPAEGVRIAKIKRLEDDIALNLAALGIRIIAPIPGRGTIGIEVPNKDPQMVPIREVLSSKAYAECRMELPMAMGSTIAGEVFIADLTKMPHLLVAGATGMGKSVGLNTIITSLLFKKHPAELKFVLIDPKMVEFSLYSKLEKHYLAKMPGEEAIITDPKKVVGALNSLCVEMDNRYKLLKLSGDRNIKDYNRRFVARRLNPENGHRYLPYIVVIVDEFADLIMTAGKEVETPVARIAQKARAVGIHMILATQRPSTNVITGVIKANFPGRVAFRVTQMVDSRTILDRPGANQLIGRGDMLFSRDGDISRVQCAFIDTDEVEGICETIDNQIGYPEPYLLPEYVPEADGEEGSALGSNSFGERDPLYDDVARTVVTSGLGSTSSIQRRYSIGYVRAGKIMDQLEAAGIVGPAQGGKPRKVLVDIVTLEDMLNQ